MLAETIKNPQEIWLTATTIKNKDKDIVHKRYISWWEVDKNMIGIAVFEWGGLEWRRITTFSHEYVDKKKYQQFIDGVRRGKPLYLNKKK